MSSKHARKKLAREKLLGIIEMCKSVDEGFLDPFLVEIGEAILLVRKYLHEWELPEIIVTGTASGKSLAYNLPILDYSSVYIFHDRRANLQTEKFHRSHHTL